MASNAFRSTAFLADSLCSKSAAFRKILTDVGIRRAAVARIDLPTSGGCRRAASNHTSSLSGHVSHPCWISFRACNVFPAASSTRAEAIQPGPCLGFVSLTDLSRSRALTISPTSAADVILDCPIDVR